MCVAKVCVENSALVVIVCPLHSRRRFLDKNGLQRHHALRLLRYELSVSPATTYGQMLRGLPLFTLMLRLELLSCSLDPGLLVWAKAALTVSSGCCTGLQLTIGFVQKMFANSRPCFLRRHSCPYCVSSS